MFNKNLNFLIVDELSSVRQAVKSMLNEIGFMNTDEAEDGQAALEKLQNGNFDFVISDWCMQNMDGLTMLQNVRESEILKEIPVLIVAKEVKKLNILAAIKAGANGYLAKPFSTNILSEKLNIIAKNMENCTDYSA